MGLLVGGGSPNVKPLLPLPELKAIVGAPELLDELELLEEDELELEEELEDELLLELRLIELGPS